MFITQQKAPKNKKRALLQMLTVAPSFRITNGY